MRSNEVIITVQAEYSRIVLGDLFCNTHTDAHTDALLHVCIAPSLVYMMVIGYRPRYWTVNANREYVRHNKDKERGEGQGTELGNQTGSYFQGTPHPLPHAVPT